MEQQTSQSKKVYSKWNYEKLAVVVRIVFRMVRVVVRPYLYCIILLLRGTEKKCTKVYKPHAQLLFFSLNLLFGDVLVAVVAVELPIVT